MLSVSDGVQGEDDFFKNKSAFVLVDENIFSEIQKKMALEFVSFSKSTFLLDPFKANGLNEIAFLKLFIAYSNFLCD